MSYEVDDFQEDVIETSHEKPVVVDFWAPWCGPCHQLGPTLESLAQEHADEWRLVKINTDENAVIAQQYRIRGIPAVKLFVDGEVVSEFTGAMPRPAIKKWLDEALPSESKQYLEQAREALAQNDQTAARAHLEAVLNSSPDNREAQILLARALLFDDPEKARTLADEPAVANPALRQTQDAVRTLARLLSLDGSRDTLPEEPGRKAYVEAISALRQENFDEAIKAFIQVINVNRYYDDDGPRKACVALFTVLGNQHPAVRENRRTFDMALY